MYGRSIIIEIARVKYKLQKRCNNVNKENLQFWAVTIKVRYDDQRPNGFELDLRILRIFTIYYSYYNEYHTIFSLKSVYVLY